MKPKIFIFIIFLLAFCLRIYGLNWDQGQHLHPDERFLTMVETTIQIPSSLSQYLDTLHSPLNPYNYKDYQFFVYGTFPLFLTKYVGELMHQTGYDRIYLVGRVLSAFVDSLSVICLYLLSLIVFRVKPKTKIKDYIVYLPSLLYALAVLPIQLSHFFAVDTYLSFFLLLTFVLLIYYLENNRKYLLILAGVCFGIALASKISAAYFTPIIGIVFVKEIFSGTDKLKRLYKAVIHGLYFSLFVLLSFRFFQPYAFLGFFRINPLFVNNLKELSGWISPETIYPPAIQWLSKPRLIFSLKNIVVWGFGFPLSSMLAVACLGSLSRKIKLNFPLLLAAVWTVYLLIYQGLQFAQTIRYFIPIFPMLCLLSAYGLNKYRRLIFLALMLHSLWALAFLHIYSVPHTRVQASSWIFDNISPGSSVTNEYWDDPLPLYLPFHDPGIYNGHMVSLFDPDTPSKWQSLNQVFGRADYMFLTSNRLWGSIPLVPLKYPITTVFYNNLFDNKLKFRKIAEINSYPGFSLPFLRQCYYFGPTVYPSSRNSWFSVDKTCSYPGVYIRDDSAEESFTVYDHPKVLIFKNLQSSGPQ